MKKKSSDYLSKAILIALILIVVDLIGGFGHLRFEKWFSWTSTLIMGVALVIVSINYGKQQNHQVTYGQVFGYAFKVALVISAIVALYSLLSNYVIFPEFRDQLLEKTRADLEAKGGMSEDQIDTAMTMTKKFIQPVPIAIFAFLGTLFFGTISALIGAAVTKKNPPDIFQNNP